MPAYLALAAAIVLVGGGAYTCSTKGGSDDRLTDNQAGMAQRQTAGATAANERTGTVDPARRCASGPTYTLLKRELFRRAAQIRGHDDALFERIAGVAAIRVERPIVTSSDEGLGSIACGATAAIDLPPGLAVAGGRTTLTADLGYTLQRAGDSSGDVLTLSNADAITIPLATLAKSDAAASSAEPSAGAVPVPAPPAAAPVPPAPPPPPVSAQSSTPPPPVQSPAPRPSASVAPRASANPSFPCARARTRGEMIICGDQGLAALDRQMAAQYRSAYSAAGPEQRDALRATAHRFYGFRDNCPTSRCIADGYRQRMAEIDDIMQDR